jgi:hypothetical protein
VTAGVNPAYVRRWFFLKFCVAVPTHQVRVTLLSALG